MDQSSRQDQSPIKLTADGNAVLMDFTSLTDSLILELAHEVAKDPQAWVSRMQDIIAIQQVEERGFSVEGTSVRDHLDGIYNVLGVPVLTLTPVQASNHGKEASELAYATMSPADRQVRDAFTERKETKARQQHAATPKAMAQVQPIPTTDNTPVYNQVKADQNHG